MAKKKQKPVDKDRVFLVDLWFKNKKTLTTKDKKMLDDIIYHFRLKG